MATFGVLLFLASPFVGVLGGGVKHDWRCRGRTFEGFDDCFSDMLPLELVLVPLGLLLAPLFAVVAYSIWAPARRDRARRWRFARLGDAIDNYPEMAVLSALLSAWPAWRALAYPPWGPAFPFIAFWILFAIWFAAAAVCSRSDRRR